MKNFSIILSTVAVILAATAMVKVSKLSTTEVPTEAVANALLENPKMVVEALQAHQQQQVAEQEKAAKEALAKYADEINSSANAPFVGPEDAKVTVVEFFDFSCGYCKRLAPAMEKVMADNKDVKFVFKPLSFVAAVSNYQAKGALAAYKQGKFIEFYKAVLEYKDRMTETAVDEIAKKLGLDMEKFKTDLVSEEVNKNLGELSILAQRVRINGVPAVLINGEHIQTLSSDDLQEAINNAK